MNERAENGRVPTTTKADLDAVTIGGARPHGGPVHLAEYDPVWPVLFAKEAARIAQTLGETAMRIEHVGSTSVPDLAAKPIIDIVMAVTDSSDESSYVTPLAAHGYELRLREPNWYQHRVLKGPDTDINLHVFTLGCPEVDRMIRFRNHLRRNPIDRKLYDSAKRELANRDWEFIQNYADAKTEVIEQIMVRAGEAAN
jgi:GrpB-like predicted nucleotidyltransferase (UPF0157 family)